MIKKILNDGITRRTNTESFSSETVNVCDFGADPTGAADSTEAITAAHNTGKCVYYPCGRYRFNGENLCFDGGVRFERTDGVLVHNDIDSRPVLIFDDIGNFVGLRHNHLESYNEERNERMTVGNLVPPPLSESEYEKRFDFMAHFYNDFGKEYSRHQCGWKGWYNWSWNYHDAGLNNPLEKMHYHAERDPLLGYYRGDDPVVLDWICYWLAEYGATGVIITAGALDNWEDERSQDHWCWQLFNNAKNFKRLKYGIMMPGIMLFGDDPNKAESIDITRKKIRKWWDDILQKTYFSPNFDNCYMLKYDDFEYPMMFIFEEEYLYYMLDRDGGTAGAEKFLSEIADKFKAHGYHGFSLLIRQRKGHYGEDFSEKMRGKGVLIFTGYYEQGFMTWDDMAKGKSYSSMVDAVNYPEKFDGRIGHVFTGANTLGPHPSCWEHPGNCPEEFERLIDKTADFISRADAPRLVTAYNVSEWSEGGPGIQPNIKDGFGYLDAIYNDVVAGKAET